MNRRQRHESDITCEISSDDEQQQQLVHLSSLQQRQDIRDSSVDSSSISSESTDDLSGCKLKPRFKQVGNSNSLNYYNGPCGVDTNRIGSNQTQPSRRKQQTSCNDEHKLHPLPLQQRQYMQDSSGDSSSISSESNQDLSECKPKPRFKQVGNNNSLNFYNGPCGVDANTEIGLQAMENHLMQCMTAQGEDIDQNIKRLLHGMETRLKDHYHEEMSDMRKKLDGMETRLKEEMSDMRKKLDETMEKQIQVLAKTEDLKTVNERALKEMRDMMSVMIDILNKGKEREEKVKEKKPEENQEIAQVKHMVHSLRTDFTTALKDLTRLPSTTMTSPLISASVNTYAVETSSPSTQPVRQKDATKTEQPESFPSLTQKKQAFEDLCFVLASALEGPTSLINPVVSAPADDDVQQAGHGTSLPDLRSSEKHATKKKSEQDVLSKVTQLLEYTAESKDLPTSEDVHSVKTSTSEMPASVDTECQPVTVIPNEVVMTSTPSIDLKRNIRWIDNIDYHIMDLVPPINNTRSKASTTGTPQLSMQDVQEKKDLDADPLLWIWEDEEHKWHLYSEEAIQKLEYEFGKRVRSCIIQRDGLSRRVLFCASMERTVNSSESEKKVRRLRLSEYRGSYSA